MLAVGVVDAAVAGAHEQARLRKPRDRAAQVGAVDREHQELIFVLVVLALVADVDAGERGDAVPRLAQRIVEIDPPRFVERKVGDRPQVDPDRPPLSQAEEIADQRDAEHDRGHRAEDAGQPVARTCGGRCGVGVGCVRRVWSDCSMIRISAIAAAGYGRLGRSTLPVARQSASSATRSSISAEVSGLEVVGAAVVLGVSSACRGRGGR